MSKEKYILAWAKRKGFNIGTFVEPIQIFDEWHSSTANDIELIENPLHFDYKGNLCTMRKSVMAKTGGFCIRDSYGNWAKKLKPKKR